MTLEIKKTRDADGMRMLRSMSAFLFVFLLAQPGCAFELYDILKQKRVIDLPRGESSSSKESLLSNTEQCIAERCRQLEQTSGSKIYADTLQEVCILRCLLAVQEDIDAPVRLSGDLKPKHQQLRSRELDEMDACVRTKCNDIETLVDYSSCVYNECMEPLGLGQYRRSDISASQNDVDLGRLLRSAAAARDRKDKRIRVLGRGLSVEKRPISLCDDCYPTPTDMAKYAKCRDVCRG